MSEAYNVNVLTFSNAEPTTPFRKFPLFSLDPSKTMMGVQA
jgi:hypothetical protein